MMPIYRYVSVSGELIGGCRYLLSRAELRIILIRNPNLCEIPSFYLFLPLLFLISTLSIFTISQFMWSFLLKHISIKYKYLSILFGRIIDNPFLFEYV